LIHPISSGMKTVSQLMHNTSIEELKQILAGDCSWLSNTTLNRLYVKVYGVTKAKYEYNLKVARARALFEEGVLTDEEIGKQVGLSKGTIYNLFKDSPQRQQKTLMTRNAGVQKALQTKETSWKRRLGVDDLADWKTILGDKFVAFEETYAEAMAKYGMYKYAASEFKFFYEPSFQEHINSTAYRELLSKKNHFNTSKAERELVLWLEELGYKASKLRIRGGYELDIYIAELQLGFELNGYPWHLAYSSGFGDPKPRDYHKKKQLAFAADGIACYMLWYNGLIDLPKIKEKILTILGRSERIFARRTELRQVAEAEARDFLAVNHDLGEVLSSVRLGLYFKGVLVQLITFKRTETGWLNNRLCTKKGCVVVGGFSKLMKGAKKLIKGEVLTYCDRDSSPLLENVVYFKQGWEVVPCESLMMRYWNKVTQESIARNRLMKSKIDDGSGRTEWEMAADLNWYPYYNSGFYKFRIVI